MSRICIVGSSNIKHISLISLYTSYFDQNKIPYDIIYWDRHGIDEEVSAENKFCYRAIAKKGKIKKLFQFFSFRRFALRILKEKKYDIIITWQTTTAYLLYRFLMKSSSAHIINVRDYVMENSFFAKRMIRKMVAKSAMNAISSDGFREFLPAGDYIKVNSINDSILMGIEVLERPRTQPYKIGFAGNCRYFRECYKLIDALSNDPRFEVWYCGTNSEHLSEYAKTNGVNNVFTLPGFNTKETIKIFEKFDIVNSAFGSDAMDNRTLVPIRLYTALALGLPMLVSSGTQLATEVEKGKVGFVISSYDRLADELFSYLSGMDEEMFLRNCSAYMKNARFENEKFYEKLSEIIAEVRN